MGAVRLDKSSWYPAPEAFEEVKMENVQGSGLLIEGDLEYNITVRLLFLPPMRPPVVKKQLY